MDPILPDRMTVELLRQRILQANSSGSSIPIPQAISRAHASNRLHSGSMGFQASRSSAATILFPSGNPSAALLDVSPSESASSQLSALRQLDWSRLQRRQERNVSATAAPSLGGNSASVHPSFRSKVVCKLSCRYCSQDICNRGMKAILLADTRVELYSTDSVPNGRVQLVAEDYMTRNCHCKIRDVGCLGCGNVVGYHVTQPCDVCLGACNNGHFYMFHDDAVAAQDRVDNMTKKSMVWAQLPVVDKESEARLGQDQNSNVLCR